MTAWLRLPVATARLTEPIRRPGDAGGIDITASGEGGDAGGQTGCHQAEDGRRQCCEGKTSLHDLLPEVV